MANPFVDALAKLHAKIDADRDIAEARWTAVLKALHHLCSRDPTMDHDALLALANTISGKADTALSNFEALEADHGVKVQALDDIGDVLTKVGGTLDKIVAAPAAPAPATGAQVTGAALAGVAG